MRAASINLTETGALVAGVPGVRHIITGLTLVASATLTVAVTDEDGAALIGPMTLAANVPVVLPADRGGYYAVPTAGKGLRLAITGVGQVGGCVSWREMRSA